MLKFDIKAIQEKLNKQKEQAESSKNKNRGPKDIKTDLMVKVDKGGKHNFRAVPYVHNKDYLVDPFAERYYHFGIPGTSIFYCPAKNSGGKCDVCDFIWAQMTENKGKRDDSGKFINLKWKDWLPKKRVLIPGLIRGREDEGVKFFSLSTYEDKLSEHLQKIYDYLKEPETFDFLDPENGYDFILTYKEYSPEEQKRFYGAKFGFKALELERWKRTAISEDPVATWNEMLETMPNVDSIPRFEPKTQKDSQAVLMKWLKQEQENTKLVVDERTDTEGSSVVVEEEDVPSAVEVSTTSASALSSNDERKARAKAMLKKVSV